MFLIAHQPNYQLPILQALGTLSKLSFKIFHPFPSSSSCRSQAHTPSIAAEVHLLLTTFCNWTQLGGNGLSRATPPY